jgi:putative transposase
VDQDEVNPAIQPEIVTQLSERQRQRLEVIQDLIAAPDQATYHQRQQAAAKRLNLSISSIQRLVREWKKKGIAGLSWRERSDRGQFRIGEDWQSFIVKTYQDGNRGSLRMSPAQVAVRVKVRAQELNVDHYPSHMSVYRILKPLIEKAQQSKRSLGW